MGGCEWGRTIKPSTARGQTIRGPCGRTEKKNWYRRHAPGGGTTGKGRIKTFCVRERKGGERESGGEKQTTGF